MIIINQRHSKLLDGRSQVQSPVALVELAVRGFPRNSRKYGLGSLRKAPHGGHSLVDKRTVGLGSSFNNTDKMSQLVYLHVNEKA